MPHRFLVQAISGLLLAMLVGFCSLPLQAEDKAAPKPLKALLIVGGCCHDYAAQKEIISKGIAERAHIEFTVVHQGGSTTNTRIPLYDDPNWAKGYDIVIHNECFADVKDNAWTQRILKPHQEGVPAVVIHCAMHCYRDGTDDWFDFCGVTSRRHGAHYGHEVLNRDADHPIMKGFGAAWANPAGELYWIEKMGKTTHPLASAKNREKGNEEVCVWTNMYGDTRVFGTTLGHHNETMKDPKFMDLLTRGTLWACGKLEDEYLKTAADAGPKLVPKNIAVGAKATASSEETAKNNLAAHAFDNNEATRWCANGGSFPQTLTVDLGKPQKLTGCELIWESPNYAYRYKIEGSTDGKEWKPLVNREKNQDKEGVDKFENTPELQHLRLTALGSQHNSWASVREFKVFGTEMEEVAQVESAKKGGEEILREVRVPEGFEATVFAAPPAVNYPVFVAAAPDGVVYVAVDKNGSLDRAPNRGSIVRLRDLDGDGRADESKLFVANVDSPRGMVWDHDRLYVLHPPHISAFIDNDGDGISDEQKILVKNIAFGFKDRPADHTSNGLTMGIDGWIYAAIGDFGFMEAEGTDGTKLSLRAGGVVRFRPDGSGLQLYSRGTRNILEVGVDGLLNGFTRDNTNDGGGWDIRLHHFTGLEEHGYPSLYINFGDEHIKPLADYGGGSGCGGLYLDEPGFPEGFGDAMYTADWGRSIIYRHRMTPSGATFTPDQTEFLAIPRVTDLDVDANSHVYAASWKGATFTYAGENVGYLVRVSPKGYQPETLPNFEKLSDADLVKQLTSNSHRRRIEASRALIRRGLSDEAAKGIAQLAGDTNQSLKARVAAIFTLKQGQGEKSHAALAKLCENPDVRAYAIRALADRWDEKNAPVEPILAGLKDSQPRVKLEAIVALARLGDVKNGAAMLPLLEDKDPVISHTAVKALVMLKAKDAAMTVVDDQNASPELRTGALRVLQALHQPEVVDALIERLGKETDSARRQGLFSALARLHFTEGPWKGNSWGTRPDTSGPYYQPEPWEATPRIAAALQGALTSAQGDEPAAMLKELSRHKIQLSGGLDSLLAMAAKDASVLPIAIAQLSRASEIPANALPLLISAAGAKESSAAIRSQAAIALLKSNKSEGFPAALAAVAALYAENPKSNELQAAREALLSSAALDQRAETLREIAVKNDGPTSLWAEAGLVKIGATKNASPEARQLALVSIDEGWKVPARRVQLLEAAQLANERSYEGRVREAMSDGDEKVSTVAKNIAKAWRLPEQPTLATGPKLGTLKVEDVLATVVSKQPGDPTRGEPIFAKLGCVKCHTVAEGEPLRGPHLPSVAKTYKRDQLAEAVLLPSKSVAQGFVTNIFILDDGTQLTGFVTKEAVDEILVRDAEGREIRLDPERIEDRVKQTISIMPEGLAKELTVEEFSALIDYVQSLGK